MIVNRLKKAATGLKPVINNIGRSIYSSRAASFMEQQDKSNSFSGRSSYNDREYPYQEDGLRTHRETPRSSNLNDTLFQTNLSQLNIFRNLYGHQKLQTAQQNFYARKNARTAYIYFRELNRQKKYHVVVELYNAFHMELNASTTDRVELNKLKEQFNYAFDAVYGVQKTAYFSKRTAYILFGLGYLAYWGYIMFYENSEKEAAATSQQGVWKGAIGKADSHLETDIQTKFSDVLGIDEFKEELMELVDYLKNPQKYIEAGAKIPKGILLCGPPGTGKTLLARALAGEAQCSFIYKSGSEFDEMYVGIGAKRVREMFQLARKNSPAIIFIDEIDSVAGRRKPGDQSYARDTINQLLTEMDGFKQGDPVIVIGATNLEEGLDPAIKRPGRFDKIINVPFPDIRGREEIFDYYLKKIPHDDDVDKNVLARKSSGYTGADIQNIVNLAILNAVKNNRKKASQEDFEYAHDRVVMGVGRKNMVVSEKQKKITAYHEGGHALISLLTEGAMPLHKVTILPRGGSLGHTAMLPEDDDDLQITRKGVLASIDVAMGGRVAEELILGEHELTTGCSSDLTNATRMAYSYVRRMGMAEKNTFIVTDKENMSDEYNYQVDQEVQKLLKESHARVRKVLKQNEDKLQKLATELMKKETMLASDVKKLLELTN